MVFFPKEGVDLTFSIEHQLQRCKWLSVRVCKEEKKNHRKKQKELNIL